MYDYETDNKQLSKENNVGEFFCGGVIPLLIVLR